MEDFNKPKIIYPETTQGAYFAYDKDGLYIDKTCFMLIAKDALYIQKTLSSRLFAVTYKSIFSSIELGEHGYQYNKHALIKLPIIKECNTIHLLELLNEDNEIDRKVYELYGLSEEEIRFIESQ